MHRHEHRIHHLLSSQAHIKLDDEKWRSHFVCVITNGTRFHSMPNTEPDKCMVYA